MAAKHASPRLGNHNFRLSKKHLTREAIVKMKYQCDDRASAALSRLQHLSKLQGLSGAPWPDLYSVLSENRYDPALSEFWDELHVVPEWVDWAQLERGQETFWRYGLANLVGFAMQGFMGGNAATPSIAEVLIRTGGFSTEIVLRRALETFQGLLQTTRSLKDLQPGGAGHISLIRVRLLHANVRQRILHLCQSQPDYFNSELYGIPINTCDDIHTIALFACNPIWLELPAMGLEPQQDEADDYIAMFRYVAYVLGVPHHYFANTKIAKIVMESFCIHDCQPAETSRILCHNFIVALKDVPPINLSEGFIAAASRTINGNDMSDALGIIRPAIIHSISFRGFCWLAQSFVTVQRLFPLFDKYMINIQRKLLYSYIVEGSSSKFGLGRATRFAIKYIPRVGKSTVREPSVIDSGFLFRPLECLFLAIVVLICSIGLALLLAAWMMMHTVLKCLIRLE